MYNKKLSNTKSSSIPMSNYQLAMYSVETWQWYRMVNVQYNRCMLVHKQNNLHEIIWEESKEQISPIPERQYLVMTLFQMFKHIEIIYDELEKKNDYSHHEILKKINNLSERFNVQNERNIEAHKEDYIKKMGRLQNSFRELKKTYEKKLKDGDKESVSDTEKELIDIYYTVGLAGIIRFIGDDQVYIGNINLSEIIPVIKTLENDIRNTLKDIHNEYFTKIEETLE